MQTEQSKTTFSVIGYYPDNDQTYSECVEADSESDALEKLSELIDTTVIIVAVIPGEHPSNDGLEYTVEVSPSRGVEDDQCD